MSRDAELKKLIETMTPFPWERRGWKFYVKGTQKVVFEVRLAWKSSAETEATAKYIRRALNEFAASHADDRPNAVAKELKAP